MPIGSRLLRLAKFVALPLAFMLTPAQAEEVVLRVGVQPYLNDIWAGVAAGSFAEKGLKLEFQTFTSASSTFAALQGGAIQMAIGGMASYYVARANGQDIRWIATTANVNHGDACMVAPNSKITAFSDLKGKKVAFVHNSVVHGPVLAMLEKNGLSSSDVELLNLQPAIATAALLKGDIDLACVWGPFTYQIEDIGGKRLFTMADTPSGGWSYSGYVVSAAWAKEHPEAVAAFLKGLKEGQEAYLKDKQPAIDTAAKETGLSPDIGRRQSEEIFYVPVTDSFAKDSKVTMCGAASGRGIGTILAQASEFFVKAGTLKKVLPYEEFLDPQYGFAAFGGEACTVK